MTRPTSAKRTASYRDRMKSLGFVQVSFLVPSDTVDSITKLALEARARHLAERVGSDDD